MPSSSEHEHRLSDNSRAMYATAELVRSVRDGNFAKVFARQCARDRVSTDYEFLRDMGDAMQRVIFRTDGKLRSNTAAAKEARQVIRALCKRSSSRADVEYFVEVFDGFANSRERCAREHWKPTSKAELFGLLVGVAKSFADRGIAVQPAHLPVLAKAAARQMPQRCQPTGSSTDFKNALIEFTRFAPLSAWFE